MRISGALLVILCAGGAAPAVAQQREEPTDSLKQEIRRLKARLDSLEALLRQLIRQGQDTSRVSDELAALRAAAQAAGEAGAAQDTTEQQESRTRSLSILNPEISVTGDVVGYYLAPDGADSRVSAVPREFEFSFQAALDPYTRTKVFVSYEEELPIAGFPEDEGGGEGRGGFELEEGYLYWVGLPGSLGLKAGKFRQEIGNYNRWHTHALYETDRSMPSVVFLGDDGLIQTGLSLVSPALTVGPATNTATFELTAGTNDALFGDGAEPSYLGRLQSFWDLGPSTYVQLGGNGLWGQNSGDSLETTLWSLDFAFRWAPPARALYQALHLKGEWYWVRQELAGAGPWQQGGYLQANYRAGRRWIFGTRADYLAAVGTDPAYVQVVPSITWWQSEWVYLRAQYNYLKPENAGGNHTLFLQVVWLVGPHRHENY